MAGHSLALTFENMTVPHEHCRLLSSCNVQPRWLLAFLQLMYVCDPLSFVTLCFPFSRDAFSLKHLSSMPLKSGGSSFSAAPETSGTIISNIRKRRVDRRITPHCIAFTFRDDSNVLKTSLENHVSEL